MSGRPNIIVVHPPGKAREELVDALGRRSVISIDTPQELSVAGSYRVILVHESLLAAALNNMSVKKVTVALLSSLDTASTALQAGADDVLVWPSPPALVQKRIAQFLDENETAGRIVLNPGRVTSLAHALRNPLNVITLYAELLRMESLGDDALGSVGRLVRAAKRVDALISELETLLYLEVQAAPIQCQPIEISELVDIVLAELRYDIEDKPLQLSVSRAEIGTVAFADPDLCRRAIHAVLGRVAKLALGNAKVHIRTLGSPPVIEIQAPIHPIPPHRIQAFHTAATELDARESLGGVGVGLSFAHGALKAMNARLEHSVAENGEAISRLVFSAPD
ncbi:MAG: hypothetical protein KTR25_11445 [Myxococcales bacterium]|nr:hypothetical protein [Myxococcales bacterium]